MALADRYGAIVAAVLAAGLLAITLAFGARTAGGADAFGYVSQAYLWLDGSLHRERAITADVPWPNAAESFTPLGYRPGPGTSIVPSYSPGVPLFMAALAALFGACGPFVLSPILASLGIWATFTLCRRLTANLAASTVAALLLATSPVFLVHAMVPMSDVATTTLWTLSLCALTWPGMGGAAGGGVFAGLAILARPNLAPLAIAGFAASVLWPARPSLRIAVHRGAVFALCGVVPAALFIAWLNNHLYGSPLRSGYGETRLLYSWGHAPTNLAAYGRWLFITEGAVLVPALLAAVLLRPRIWRSSVIPLVLFCAGLLGSYLFYQPQGGWTLLRFVLPAFPILFAASAVLWISAAHRVRTWVSPAIVFAVLVMLSTARLAPHARRIISLGEGENRYTAVAEYVESALPPNAVVFAMQHSGTIGFYSGKPTLRYDWFTAGRLHEALGWLHQHGYRPYLVLENWEEEPFRRRIGSDTALGRLSLRVLAEYAGGVDVRVYDPLEETPDPGRPFRLRARHECRAPSPTWREGRAP